MKMVSKVGFSLDEAEIVRRCVGKKKVEEMKEWEQKIKDKISQQKLDPKIGEVLWRIANDSANYQFNKSHSVSYAALAAISIYLKFKYPDRLILYLSNHRSVAAQMLRCPVLGHGRQDLMSRT